ncbi:triose-phosphate isomerase [Candidatus Nomurabacteria bacterium]|nr:triose-phosphate isomerase [Candidatus Nomurabacteria bacterium]USN94741.1 MAG: triose-phosphate isomerase [Candidatus Nomurabacteria bacterium]
MKTEKILVVANWKANPESKKEAEKLAKGLSKNWKSRDSKNKDYVICPPAIFLDVVAKNLPRGAALGVQDLYFDKSGAHTAMITPPMAKSIGANYSIVGHSEMRASIDTHESINKKVNFIISSSMTPILCIGENDRDENGFYLKEVSDQITSALYGISKKSLSSLIIAYEPVWAIGSGAKREATPKECQEMVIFIRKIIRDLYDADSSKKVKIIYGGSVNEENSASYIEDGMAEGFLVGRVSLDPKRFLSL